MGRIGVEAQADITPPERELTSGRSLFAREFVEPSEEDKQIATMQMADAASDCEVPWHAIDWAKAHRAVRRLQMRIAKAMRERRWGKVKALQWLLTHSV